MVERNTVDLCQITEYQSLGIIVRGKIFCARERDGRLFTVSGQKLPATLFIPIFGIDRIAQSRSAAGNHRHCGKEQCCEREKRHAARLHHHGVRTSMVCADKDTKKRRKTKQNRRMTCKPINVIHRFLNFLAIQTPLFKHFYHRCPRSWDTHSEFRKIPGRDDSVLFPNAKLRRIRLTPKFSARTKLSRIKK